MRRVPGVLVFVVVWLAMFVVPSAVVIGRHGPEWLAAAVGGLVVVAPFAWHAIGEVRRRRGRASQGAKSDAKTDAKTGAKTGTKKGGLSGWDRLRLRTVVVLALAAICCSWAAKPSPWTVLRRHALWMMPHDEAPLVAQSPLLDRVPAKADAIMWFRGGRASELESRVPALAAMTGGGDFEMVIAEGNGGGLVAVRGDDTVVDAAQRWIDFIDSTVPAEARVARRDHDGDITTWSTASWRDAPGGNPALVARLGDAPDGALVVLATNLAKPAGGVTSVLGWIELTDDALELRAAVTTIGEPVAVAMSLQADQLVRSDRASCWHDHGGTFDIAHTGGILTLEMSAPVDDLASMLSCATGPRPAP